ncbi:unnamed protein product [Parascedosporium putredinis]|uniref:Lysophospholipase n=1 Tax=Parascedosporium putredinis TaxID=1442378 RepID=A0A9P1MEX8_9PEZI|nr:unnamed protein product [Parascedosporium putredinis]CAI8002332.1 unnamed protein product [Parascedosporium putredinis]
MRTSTVFALGLASGASGLATPPDVRLNVARAAPDSPSGATRPPCWLEAREPKTKTALDNFLKRVNIADFDYASYLQTDGAYPRISIAMSGGGYRALLNGAGFIYAADDRTGGDSGISGLLQASTYFSGLSGGGWLVSTIYGNNFTTIESLMSDEDVWQFRPRYWRDLHDQVSSKQDAGFDVSLTDYWGRAVSYQLLRGDEGGAAYTFSSIADAEDFKNGETPFPILVADGRAPDTKIINLNSTVFEFNPFELGSWDPTLYGFAPLDYIGSNFTGGRVDDKGSCVRGFDQLGFVMGTSSSLFNMALLTDIPDSPLIQPIREVDVIFAVDSSADTTYNWPNGTALRASYERSLNSIANGTHFPAVPDAETFVNLKFNQEPVFFGCDAANFSSEGGSAPPLIVYIPNAPLSGFSNVSTFDPTHEIDERNDIVQNGYNVATRGNGTLDDAWPTCVACAALSRSFERTGTTPPQACQDCFNRYCWNGQLDTTAVSSYEPGLILNAEADSGSFKMAASTALWIVPAAAAWLLTA